MINTAPTLNKLVDLIKEVCLNHYMIADFDFGPLWNRNVEKLRTPYIWLEEQGSKMSMGNGSFKTSVFTFKLYCMDRIQKDESNYQEILSDTKFILDTIMTDLDQHPLFVELGLTYDKTSDILYEPVYEETDVNTNGHSAQFSWKIAFRLTPCTVPINYNLSTGVYVIDGYWINGYTDNE